MSKEALILFVKNPVLGKVKTRLATDIGDHKALEIYQALLKQLCEMSSTLKMDRYLFYSNYIDLNDDWSNNQYNKHLQMGNDLGERMKSAFVEIFRLGYEKVALIGSDIYGLKSSVINQAFQELDTSDVVIGPAEDGGYYLIGMKKLILSPFTLNTWSHQDVLADTINILDRDGYSFTLLDKLRDIDLKRDLVGTSLEKLL